MLDYDAVGMDIGTCHIVVCIIPKDSEDGRPEFHIQRNAFFKVEKGDLNKGILNESGVSYVEDPKIKALYVVGEDAIEFAQNMGGELNRPMHRGAISSKEQSAVPIIREIVKSVLVDVLPTQEEIEKINKGKLKKKRLVYSIPAMAIDNPDIDIGYHSDMMAEIIMSLGFEAQPMNEGQAIIYSEMKSEQYTGIAISFGAGMMNVCTCIAGMPINQLTFSIAKSGDWIDENSGKAADVEKIVIQTIKEGDDFSLLKDYESGKEKAISMYYKMLIKDQLVPAFEERFLSATFSPKKPVNIVLSGGTAKVKGFLQMFQELFPKRFKNKIGMDIDIGNSRLVRGNTLLPVAKGCLYKAIIDKDK